MEFLQHIKQQESIYNNEDLLLLTSDQLRKYTSIR